MCRMITDMEHSQSAGPILNKLKMKVYVNDAEFISMDVTIPEWCKPALFGASHMYDCIKTAICIYYLSYKQLPCLHKCVIIYDEGLIVCSKRSGGRANAAPISDSLHLFGSIKMQSKFSLCLVIDLQFVLGHISFESVWCLNKVLLNGD